MRMWSHISKTFLGGTNLGVYIGVLILGSLYWGPYIGALLAVSLKRIGSKKRMATSELHNRLLSLD